MFTYALIGLCLVLVGFVGLQLTYMFYIEKLYKMRIEHTRLLEREAKMLRLKVGFLEGKLAEKNALLEKYGIENEVSDEVWADILEDRG
jgi:hypothetical protein